MLAHRSAPGHTATTERGGPRRRAGAGLTMEGPTQEPVPSAAWPDLSSRPPGSYRLCRGFIWLQSCTIQRVSTPLHCLKAVSSGQLVVWGRQAELTFQGRGGVRHLRRHRSSSRVNQLWHLLMASPNTLADKKVSDRRQQKIIIVTYPHFLFY